MDVPFRYSPRSRLHQVRRIAPEFYNNLSYYISWSILNTYDFITDPAIGHYTRMKRIGFSEKQNVLQDW